MGELGKSNHATLAVSTMNVVKAIERHDDKKIRALYFNKERAVAFGGLCKKMAAEHRFYKLCEDSELEKLCETPHHGGVVAIIERPQPKTLNSESIDEIIKSGNSVIALDGVSNPLNFGAIVRSAAFFGLNKIVITNEYPLINGASYRASEGSIEESDIFTVQNMEQFLEYCKKITQVVASVTHTTKNSLSLSKLGEKNCVLVLGNEETGVKKSILKICDATVTIPKQNEKVDSLNVAQAAAILSYFLSGGANATS